jgi:isopentenyldiphosphate isomerase
MSRKPRPRAGQNPEEVFEVYDGQGRKTGHARRAEVHGNPALVHRVVHVLVFNRRGDLYLQKRSAHKDTQAGKWDTSVGGHLNLGEGFDAAARRELSEELGVDQDLPLAHLYDYPMRCATESENVRTYAVVYDGPITPNPVEISDGRFWSQKEILETLGSGAFAPQFELEYQHYREWAGVTGPRRGV